MLLFVLSVPIALGVLFQKRFLHRLFYVLYCFIGVFLTLSHKSIQNHGYIVPINVKILFRNC